MHVASLSKPTLRWIEDLVVDATNLHLKSQDFGPEKTRKRKEKKRKRFSVARRAIGVPARVGITARAPTTVVYIRGRCVLLPFGHAVRLIPVAPIASFAHVPFLADHLLLRPDGVAAGIVPLAWRGGAGRGALLIIERDAVAQAEAHVFDFGTDVYAHALRASLACLATGEFRSGAGWGAGAVNVSRWFLPGLKPKEKKKERKGN